MRAALVLSTLLAPALALAQQMPEAREMSGIPRPDEAVEAATVTVRVLHGEFSKPAAPGTPVHLVSVDADGSVKKRTAMVREDGRAHFGGLVTGGSVAYYAFTLLGDDRLESAVMTLPPMVGIRLMLVGRKLDPNGQPIGAPADDQIGEQGGPALPAGQVTIQVRSPSPVDAIELVEVGGGVVAKQKPTGTPQSNAYGAVFKGVTGSRDKVFVARVFQGGRTFLSRPFMITEKSGAGAAVWVIGQLLLDFHMVAELDDDRLVFQSRFELTNLTGVPWNPGKEGVKIPLPLGFAGPALAEEELARKVRIVDGDAVYWMGVVPPSQVEFTMRWSAPIHGGKYDFFLDAPLGVFRAQLVFEHPPGSTLLDAPQGVTPRITRLDNGREYWVLSNVSAPPRGRIQLRLEGLPRYPSSQKVVKIVVFLFVVSLIGWAVWVALRTTDPAKKTHDAIARRRELVAQRERLYEQLVSLETDRAAGKVDEPVFVRERNELIAKLTVVHRNLDDLDAGMPARAAE